MFYLFLFIFVVFIEKFSVMFNLIKSRPQILAQACRFKGHYPRYQTQAPQIELDMIKKSAARQFNYDTENLGKWGQNNDMLYPPRPQGDTQPKRPREIFHGRVRCRISHKNMSHACWFVQGMNVDEAIQRLRIHHRKTFLIMADILEEAKEKAMKPPHFFQTPSNMHVAVAKCHMDSQEQHTKYNGNFPNIYRTKYTNIYWRDFLGESFLLELKIADATIF